MPEQVRLSYLTLPEALQDIFVHQRTGVLSVAVGELTQRLFFFSGELYLAGLNPLRDELEDVLSGPSEAYDDPRFDPQAYLERGLRRVVRDLGDRLAKWDPRDLLFEAMGAIPDDLAGPVPTGGLVMDLCSRGRPDTQLLERLGGLDTRYRATDEVMLRRRIPELDGGETRLLDRLEHTADVRTLIAESGGRASVVLCELARLEAVRLIAADSDYEGTRSLLSTELLEDISARVLASLDERPLELDEVAHRARLGKLLQDYSRQSYYELLGVGGGAAPEEVHRQYMELARMGHPSHATGLRMKDRGRRLEWLFSRLTEAYLVLSDPERAAQYRRGLATVPPPKPTVTREKVRRSERVDLARQRYETAKEQIDEGDYHYAIELLRQSVLADPQPEYWALLGRCQLRNPKWIHMAVDSFREAVALRPLDEGLRRELAKASSAYQLALGQHETD